jgi:hypothetical protein
MLGEGRPQSRKNKRVERIRKYRKNKKVERIRKWTRVIQLSVLKVRGNLASQQRRNNYLPYIFFSLSPPSKDQNRVTNITGTEHTTSLKVPSNEMDPAEIRFIRKAFIKERGSEVFRKIRPSPIL